MQTNEEETKQKQNAHRNKLPYCNRLTVKTSHTYFTTTFSLIKNFLIFPSYIASSSIELMMMMLRILVMTLKHSKYLFVQTATKMKEISILTFFRSKRYLKIKKETHKRKSTT